jgi:hypothetical protein
VTVVSLDDQASWPEPIVRHVQELARRLKTEQGMSRYKLQMEGEDSFRLLLSGHLVRAYHATRLLPHEISAIRSNGLRLLTPGLVRDRIHEAHAHGFIKDSEVTLLEQTHVYAKARRSRGRHGQVSLFLSRAPLHHSYSGLGRLFGVWGGEAISWHANKSLELRLMDLGTPAMVLADIDISGGWKKHLAAPALHRIFLDEYLESGTGEGELHYTSPIPPERIADVWTPEAAEWKRYAGLPAT